ncbi:MAG: hypothetical protein WC348_04620 [Patescibacteria group bacterium]|jgi:hypothetical protein
MSLTTNQSSSPWIQKVDEKEKLKDEIRGEVISEMKNKKRRKFFTCCFLKLLIVVLILGGITAVIAKTGLVDIPVFSKLFYKTPSPERMVSVNPDEEKKFEDVLAQKLEEQIGSKAEGQQEVALEFNEEELTSFIKSLESTNDYPFTNAQVSVTPEAIEIFGQLKDLNQTFLTVALKPEITDGNLKITFEKIKIGNLSLPAVLGNLLVNRLLKDQISSAEDVISKNGTLESIDLLDGKIIFHGEINTSDFSK